MSLSLPPQQLAQLKAVFGSRVPKDAEGAAQMLAQSPAAPAAPAALAALREALVQVAGAELSEVKEAAAAVAHSQPVDAGQRPTPGPLAARLQQLTGAASVTSAPGLDKVITPARAQALFDQVAADPRIPHKFVDDGCHFRSTLVAKAFDDAGVFTEKIVSNADRSDLKILTDTNPAGFTLCMFHMATAVWVDAGQGPERKVIDPSLGSGPMSIDEWHTHMHGLNQKPLQTYFLPRFCGHPMDRDAPPAAWQQKDLDEALAWNTEYKGFQDMLIAQGFYEQLPKMEAEMLEDHRRQAESDASAPGGDA